MGSGSGSAYQRPSCTEGRIASVADIQPVPLVTYIKKPPFRLRIINKPLAVVTDMPKDLDDGSHLQVVHASIIVGPVRFELLADFFGRQTLVPGGLNRGEPFENLVKRAMVEVVKPFYQAGRGRFKPLANLLGESAVIITLCGIQGLGFMNRNGGSKMSGRRLRQ